MKFGISNLVYSLVSLLFLGGAMFVIYGPVRTRTDVLCSEVKLEFEDKVQLMKREEVLQRLETGFGGLVGKNLKDINLHRIEKSLMVLQSVKRADVYSTPDGKLVISIHQREPFLRIQNGEQSYWVDESGAPFPIYGNDEWNIPSIGGNVSFALDRKWMKGTISMLKDLDKEKHWRGGIEKILVDSRGEYVLVPKEGKVRVVFGGPDNVEKKLRRLEKYYEYIIPAYGDSVYRSVNVKYKGQIICRKQP